MNEEYFIYHRNLLSGIRSAILRVRNSLISQMEAEAARRIAAADADLLAMKQTFDSDRNRAHFLSDRISSIREKITDCQSRLDNGSDSDNSDRLRSELRRLNGAMRRRSSEYDRVSASISDILDRMNASRCSVAISL